MDTRHNHTQVASLCSMSYHTAVVVTDLVMCYTDILATYV